MSDELVERLRSDWFGYDVSLKAIDAMEEAADRIEQLTAERDEAINQLDSAIHSQIVLEKRTAAVTEDRKFILEERDRTFALILARAEKAEAERDRLGREVNVAKYGQPDFAWSIHKAAMVDLQTDNTRLREALESLHGFADGWRECGCGDSCYGRHAERNMVLDHLHDFATAALKGETP